MDNKNTPVRLRPDGQKTTVSERKPSGETPFFSLIKKEEDVLYLAKYIAGATGYKESLSVINLLTSIILYMWHMYDESQQTLNELLKIFTDCCSQNSDSEIALDRKFYELENIDPQNTAVRYYKIFKLSPKQSEAIYYAAWSVATLKDRLQNTYTHDGAIETFRKSFMYQFDLKNFSSIDFS